MDQGCPERKERKTVIRQWKLSIQARACLRNLELSGVTINYYEPLSVLQHLIRIILMFK